MNIDFVFLLTNALLGIGLAMDAFSISVANGLSEPKMSFHKMFLISGIFAIAQFLMPLIGWTCVHTVAEHFCSFQKFIPWIALILLCYIGGNMLFDSIKKHDNETIEHTKANIGSILIQGIATSIDALSVGFTISTYSFSMALSACTIIGAVTFLICFSGVYIGKKFGDHFANKAGIIGGAILIFIGLEIFISSFLRG
ncbi:MAG: manganese efflux pump [Oscillospiraceae bacterium]|nr:manganese efflux pump [Oscillospiraceae bacterium]